MYADAEEFRVFHAKARFRATFTTLGAYIVGSTIAAPMLGYTSGRALCRANRVITTAATIGFWCSSYFFWNRLNGWTNDKRN